MFFSETTFIFIVRMDSVNVEHDLNLAHEEIVSTTSSSRLEQFRFRPKKALTKDSIAVNLTKGRRF